ncbi:aldose epimerase family protein [Thioclava sp. 15-R06ZXC-3]|uniref:Aldose epimerase family protein n=1 Tax=Thioclava arctica TaxID=3238301 RepID=A0ABV3TP42_9RHOB
MAEPMCKIALPSGVQAVILPFGAVLHSLQVPDRNGVLGEVLMGPKDPRDHRHARGFHGATVGRFANRIGSARFTLNDETFDLSANEGPTCLHGGIDGFDRRDWQVLDHRADRVTLGLFSPDGDQGFPGDLEVEAEFALSEPGTLTLTYRARVSRACPVSITSHGYFNLVGGGPVRDHLLCINAQRYLPVDAALIPLGAPRPVADTMFDYRALRPVLRQGDPGIDHCFCLEVGEEMHEAATLYDPVSGRVMQITTNQPGLQLYTVNSPAVDVPVNHALCLEPQAWPDAPNRPDFPNAILEPGESYFHQTRLAFTTRSK